jgi:hypothetical protein
MLIRCLILSGLLSCPAIALAWGELGHRAIGEAVQASLDETTREAIAKIVAPGQPLADGTLAELSMWPDQIKDVATMSPEEQHAAHAFNAAHPSNKSWHFVNLPLKAPGYPDLPATGAKDPVRKFVRTERESGDIVQKLTEVIDILESPTEPQGWTKKQALAWLLHLVEDLHQPLHVGSSFYRLGRNNVPRLPMLTIPAAAAHKHVACDRGGNQLQFENPHVTLHSIWDNCLVQVEAGLSCIQHSGLPGVATLAAKIRGWLQEPTPSVSRPKGDHHEWPRRWATDSLHVADESEAYHITLTNPRTTGGVVKTHPTEPCSEKGQRILFSISTPTVMEEYVSQFRPVAALQLTKAAVRLTELLRQIQWK